MLDEPTMPLIYWRNSLAVLVRHLDPSLFVLQIDIYYLGIDGGLSVEDNEALAGVLPGAELFYSDFAFYLHAASLFKSSSLVCHDVHFSQLALSVAHPEADTIGLWHSVIKGHIDLALYEDAYASLIACPHDKLYVLLCGYVWYHLLQAVPQETRMRQRASLPNVRRECCRKTDDLQFCWIR
jgi:hypothetical protein